MPSIHQRSLDGSTLLRFRTVCCRVTDSDLNSLLDIQNVTRSVANHDTCLDQKPISMVFKPSGEEVTLVAQNANRRILKSMDAISCTSKVIKGGFKKRDLQLCDESILLTGLDKINRRQGYSLFLPDTKEKCDDYWRLGYGIELECDTELQSASESCTEYYLSEIIMELGDVRIVPSQLLARFMHMLFISCYFIEKNLII